MTYNPLPERFIRLTLARLLRERKELDGCVQLGNELSRAKETDEWITALREYIQEHYPDEQAWRESQKALAREAIKDVLAKIHVQEYAPEQIIRYDQ